jgi:hypothetical protein
LLTWLPDALMIRVSCTRALLPDVCSTLTLSLSVAGRFVLMAAAGLAPVSAAGSNSLWIVPS